MDVVYVLLIAYVVPRFYLGIQLCILLKMKGQGHWGKTDTVSDGASQGYKWPTGPFILFWYQKSVTK